MAIEMHAEEGGKAERLIRAALAHYKTGENIEGLIREVLKTEKDTFDALHMLGKRESQRGDYAGAEGLIRHALELKKSSAEAFYNLGLVLMKQGKMGEAIESFRRAIDIQPGLAMAHYNLGIALKEQGEMDEAVVSLRKALELKPDYAIAHMNLGIALREQGRLAEALASHQKAVELGPDYAVAYNNLGLLYQELGRMKEACENYETALRLMPGFAEAIRNYTSCRKFTAEDMALTERLEGLLEKTGSEEDRSDLHFALGKVHGDCCRYDEAFLHYSRGNRLERKKYSCNPQAFTEYTDRLIGIFSPDLLRKKRWSGSFSELPVFIVGMPRSGTTLIEQVISSHPLVFGGEELTYFNKKSRGLAAERNLPWPECAEALTAEDLQGIAEEYIGYLRGFSRDAVRVTDKMPSNFIHLGLISLLFRKPRVIHCMRNPLDTCISIFFQKFVAQHPYSCDLVELGHYYRDYERLMEHWRKVLPPGMMFEVRYEELVERPQEMSRRLVEFCGLGWDERCLKFYENERAVRTASSWQVRQPIYKTSKERWRRYEKHLGPLIDALSGR